MHESLKRLGEIGVLPVVAIEDASQAEKLGRALLAGDLPAAEITFRTAAAEEAIRILHASCPELLVGAGTVLTIEQVKKAVAAGAQFIVAPGFNPRVVDFCVERGVPVVPGISSASEIEMGLERGLEVLKFFPAEASGGLEFLRSIAAPFRNVMFIPLGGVEPGNLQEYFSFPRVLAVGGTWIAKSSTIAAGHFDEITRLAREAVNLCLGFQLGHVGINESSAESASASATATAELLGMERKDGNSSVFAGPWLEFVKGRGVGAHGHLAISTLSVSRAVAYFARQGIRVREETAKRMDGNVTSVYLDREVSGFAVHLLQR